MQDILANLANLHLATWKATIQVFLNHWEYQWLLVNKSTPISDQQSPMVCKSMLCNAIHLNHNFLQVEHLESSVRPEALPELLTIITSHYYSIPTQSKEA